MRCVQKLDDWQMDNWRKGFINLLMVECMLCSGYTMEGTKKLGVDAKRKKKLLAAIREKAAKAS